MPLVKNKKYIIITREQVEERIAARDIGFFLSLEEKYNKIDMGKLYPEVRLLMMNYAVEKIEKAGGLNILESDDDLVPLIIKYPEILTVPSMIDLFAQNQEITHSLLSMSLDKKESDFESKGKEKDKEILFSSLACLKAYYFDAFESEIARHPKINGLINSKKEEFENTVQQAKEEFEKKQLATLTPKKVTQYILAGNIDYFLKIVRLEHKHNIDVLSEYPDALELLGKYFMAQLQSNHTDFLGDNGLSHRLLDIFVTQNGALLLASLDDISKATVLSCMQKAMMAKLNFPFSSVEGITNIFADLIFNAAQLSISLKDLDVLKYIDNEYASIPVEYSAAIEQCKGKGFFDLLSKKIKEKEKQKAGLLTEALLGSQGAHGGLDNRNRVDLDGQAKEFVRQLQDCYSNINVASEIRELHQFICELQRNELDNSPYTEKLSKALEAYNFIINNNHYNTGRRGQLSVKEILALVWFATKDRANLTGIYTEGVTAEEASKNAKEAIVEALYAIATAYPSAEGAAVFACIGGSRNNLVFALDKIWGNFVVNYGYSGGELTPEMLFDKLQAELTNAIPEEKRIDMFLSYKNGEALVDQNKDWVKLFEDTERKMFDDGSIARSSFLENFARREYLQFDLKKLLKKIVDIESFFTDFIKTLSKTDKKNLLNSSEELVKDRFISYMQKCFKDAISEEQLQVFSKGFKLLEDSLKGKLTKALEREEYLERIKSAREEITNIADLYKGQAQSPANKIMMARVIKNNVFVLNNITMPDNFESKLESLCQKYLRDSDGYCKKFIDTIVALVEYFTGYSMMAKPDAALETAQFVEDILGISPDSRAI